jgi:hypothetical protein
VEKACLVAVVLIVDSVVIVTIEEVVVVPLQGQNLHLNRRPDRLN